MFLEECKHRRKKPLPEEYSERRLFCYQFFISTSTNSERGSSAIIERASLRFDFELFLQAITEWHMGSK